MNTQFDLDYLSKDLSGNEEIQKKIDRGMTFKQLEKYDKAIECLIELTDEYPESAVAWFTQARVLTDNFNYAGLMLADHREVANKALDALECAIKLIDDDRKDTYIQLQKEFAQDIKINFRDSYCNHIEKLIESYSRVYNLAMLEYPRGESPENYGRYLIAHSISEDLKKDGSETIFDMPMELIVETGKFYPSLLLASSVTQILNEFMKPYFVGEREREKAVQIREVVTENRRNYNIRQGMGSSLDEYDYKTINSRAPLYDLWYYCKFKFDRNITLVKFFKDINLFGEDTLYDEKFSPMLRALMDFSNILGLPVGDLSELCFPENYKGDIKDILDKIEEDKIKKAVEEQQKKKEAEIQTQEKAVVAENKKKKSGFFKFFIFLLIAAAIYYFGYNYFF